jgi:hypothetical protein
VNEVCLGDGAGIADIYDGRVRAGSGRIHSLKSVYPLERASLLGFPVEVTKITVETKCFAGKKVRRPVVFEDSEQI